MRSQLIFVIFFLVFLVSSASAARQGINRPINGITNLPVSRIATAVLATDTLDPTIVLPFPAITSTTTTTTQNTPTVIPSVARSSSSSTSDSESLIETKGAANSEISASTNSSIATSSLITSSTIPTVPIPTPPSNNPVIISSISISTSPASGPSSTVELTSEGSNNDSGPPVKIIVIAVIAPVVAISAIAFFLWCRRNRRRADEEAAHHFDMLGSATNLASPRHSRNNSNGSNSLASTVPNSRAEMAMVDTWDVYLMKMNEKPEEVYTESNKEEVPPSG